MDDTERAWLREKLYEHAAELGKQIAHQKAQDDDLRSIRTEVREGMIALRNDMASQYGHLRGEIASLKDEERRRTDHLIEEMRERDARAQKAWRVLLLIGGALIVAGQQAFEHLPAILSLMAP